MNSLIVLVAIFGCAVAQYRGGVVQNPGSAASATILRQESDINPDGSYQWSYETDNGIAAQETGSLTKGGPEPAVAAQGSFQYTSPDGTPISIQYVADENGFQPQGAHLPVAPEIPAAIQRALAWIAANPEPQQQQNKAGRF